MFAKVVQPSIVSLFSSTSSEPLQLFEQHVDPSPALQLDSLIHLLNDATSMPTPPEPGVLVSSVPASSDNNSDHEGKEVNAADRTLCQTVLHIQSPTLRTTYIRCPPHQTATSSGAKAELGLTLPWMHLQARRLGEREWAFEVGIADRAGGKGVIRCSTFQKEAAVSIHHDPPLLHVPLRFPSASSRPLTSWSTISIDLGSTIQQFRIIGASQQKEDPSTFRAVDEGDRNGAPYRHKVLESDIINVPLPSGALGRVTYVKVYANCRLRRIWFSEDKRGNMPWEFGLYASSRQ